MATKKRYYVFGGDLYLSRDGKDKNLGKATASQKKKYGGIVGDTVMDIADTITGLFSSEDKKPQKKAPKRKAKIQKETPTDGNVFTQASDFVSGQYNRRKKLFGPKQAKDYRKGGMVINTTNNKRYR
tara:strand:- start:41 stop:421 length:381 start_codon:yes stop_codon:yes gene_type:complete